MQRIGNTTTPEEGHKSQNRPHSNNHKTETYPTLRWEALQAKQEVKAMANQEAFIWKDKGSPFPWTHDVCMVARLGQPVKYAKLGQSNSTQRNFRTSKWSHVMSKTLRKHNPYAAFPLGIYVQD